MENKGGKVIAISALVVAVVALSIGFAAFADTLTINGQATAKVGSNPFDVGGDNGTGLNYKATTAECHDTNNPSTNVISGSYSTGTLSNDTWSGISVPLTSEVPSVTCTAIVENSTPYVAYLKGISANGGVRCSSSGDNATTNADNVCATVDLTVQVGSVSTDKITSHGTAQPTANNSTTGSIAAKSTNNGEATVTVTVSYDPTAVADEDVTITLPTITHSYSSASGTGN